VIWDSFVVATKVRIRQILAPLQGKLCFQSRKARLTKKKKQSYRAFARKILNLVDLPNQILFKILVTLFFFHVWPIS